MIHRPLQTRVDQTDEHASHVTVFYIMFSYHGNPSKRKRIMKYVMKMEVVRYTLAFTLSASSILHPIEGWGTVRFFGKIKHGTKPNW